LEFEKAAWNDVPNGIMGGFSFAVCAGMAWAVLAIMTNSIFSIMAIFCGLAAGFGVLVATHRKRGPLMQWTAAVSAFLSILVGYYVIDVYFWNLACGGTLGYFNKTVIVYFVTNFYQNFTLFDLFFIPMALAVAAMVPRARIAAIR
jgi:DMSO reductase anchor subunit